MRFQPTLCSARLKRGLLGRCELLVDKRQSIGFPNSE